MSIPLHPVESIDNAIHELQDARATMLSHDKSLQHYQATKAARSFIESGYVIELTDISVTDEFHDPESEMFQITYAEDSGLQATKVAEALGDIDVAAISMMIDINRLEEDAVYSVAMVNPNSVNKELNRTALNGTLELVPIDQINRHTPVLATIEDGHMDLPDKSRYSAEIVPVFWEILESSSIDPETLQQTYAIVVIEPESFSEELQNFYSSHYARYTSRWFTVHEDTVPVSEEDTYLCTVKNGNPVLTSEDFDRLADYAKRHGVSKMDVGRELIEYVSLNYDRDTYFVYHRGISPEMERAVDVFSSFIKILQKQ